MAISFVQQIGFGPGANPVSATFPSNNTVGNLLTYTGNVRDNNLGITITDTRGNHWIIGPKINSSGDAPQNFFTAYCLSCAGGPNTVTLTNNNADTNICGTYAEFSPGAGNVFSGTDGTGSAQNAGVVTTITTSSFTTTNANDLIIATMGSGGGGGTSAGSGYTKFSSANYGANAPYILGEYQIVSSIGTYTASANQVTGAYMDIVAVALKATFSPATPNPFPWALFQIEAPGGAFRPR